VRTIAVMAQPCEYGIPTRRSDHTETTRAGRRGAYPPGFARASGTALPPGVSPEKSGVLVSNLTRSEMVRLLLASRDDWLPSVRTSTGQIVGGAASRGEVASASFSCPRCGGRCVEGRPRRLRAGVLAWTVCSVCDGAGVVAGDAYTFGAPSSVAVVRERVTGESESVRLDRRRRDGELRRLERLAAAREGSIDPSEEWWWEGEKRRLWREGSYAELEAALVALRDFNELDWVAVMCVFGPDADVREIGGGVAARVERAVGWLADRMPDPIRLPAHLVALDEKRRRSLAFGRTAAHGRARADRAGEIVRLREGGASWREIERATGLSERHARRVFKQAANRGDGKTVGRRVA
jgi:hypothetical protein